MNPYPFSLALGATGLVVMALGGLGHHTGHAGHTPHASGPTGALSGHGHHGAALPNSAHGHAHQSHTGQPGTAQGKLWAFLSPRVLFGFLVGVEASGLLLDRGLFEPLVAAGALAGGVLFERYVVTPIWNGLLHFASEPAQTLERAVFEVAQAVTDFDAQGQGLIAVELDGQLVQVLGILRPEELSIGVRVRRGGRVRIEEVDAVRNRCLVSSLTP
jgi:hypothetical protein